MAAVKSITYKFRLKDGAEKEFSVRLKHPSMRLEAAPRDGYPAWSDLKFKQCSNCPLKPAQSPQCPAAVGLLEVIEFFKGFSGADVAEVTILTDDREYHKTTTLQKGLSSLMGLHMAASACPILGKLRPMIYTHLPFSTLEETLYRSMAMYLMAQFLRAKRGKEPDWALSRLAGLYNEVNTVNRAFSERLRSINDKDASLNALTSLDCFAGFAGMALEKNYFEELESLFEPYLE